MWPSKAVIVKSPGFASQKNANRHEVCRSAAMGPCARSLHRHRMGRRSGARAGCHGPNGAGIPAQYPRLAGQHADYTVAQLRAFRIGDRNNSPQMNGVTLEMTDREIAAVADYIAGLR